MAYTARVFDVDADEMFSVLVRPETYPRWLIGAEAIRDVDDDWPAVGSRFHHRVGFGPFAIPDNSEILEIRAPELLRLRVRARPFISAVATFRVLPLGDGAADGCVVTLEEEPSIRSMGNLVRPVMDPLVHVRNHRSLCRLAALLDEPAGAADVLATSR